MAVHLAPDMATAVPKHTNRRSGGSTLYVLLDTAKVLIWLGEELTG